MPASAPPSARPARPAPPPLPAFESLDRTHREILSMLGDFSRLLDHVDEHGADDEARRIAAKLFAFFTSHAREHHQHEETVVFPPLLASQDKVLVGHVRRLQQDHGWLEEDWRELGPQLEALARGYSWYDPVLIQHALPVFAKLYEEHIALEESLIYPEARRRLQAGSPSG